MVYFYDSIDNWEPCVHITQAKVINIYIDIECSIHIQWMKNWWKTILRHYLIFSFIQTLFNGSRGILGLIGMCILVGFMLLNLWLMVPIRVSYVSGWGWGFLKSRPALGRRSPSQSDHFLKITFPCGRKWSMLSRPPFFLWTVDPTYFSF